jgi:hypothetical protein
MPLSIADTAEVLALHAGGLGAGLQSRGLIDQPDVAQAVIRQAGQFGRNVALQLIDDLGVLPLVVAEELLQGADSTARGQGDRLRRLAFQVGEQATAVGMQVAKGLRIAAAVQVRPQEIIES